jgi:DNA polymerase bacteriophage-type
MILWIDFETRSRVDLGAKGVYNYAQDLSTEVLCMSYAFDDGEVVTWLPGQPLPDFTGCTIYAHNAAFERLIFWYVLQQNYPLESFYCTATQARANCAPGSLEDVGRFASASMKKDHRGAQLIRLLSIPQADGSFREDAALLAEMVKYCETDVKVMREISKAMRPLSDEELLDYHVNERINDRGVLVDVPLARAAMRYAHDELIEIEERVAELTEGEITSVRSPKMREWVLARVGEQAKKLMLVNGKYSIDKTVRANLLAMENPDEIPSAVAEVIQCASDLWASSVAKFQRLASLADEEDQRVRGAFVFAGGSATGRASSYGAQVHNLPRKSAKNPTAVRAAMVRGHEIVPKYGVNITSILKEMLRPAIIAAPGHVFINYDWSAIEARVLPWLSENGEDTLDVFRRGEDMYIATARNMFGVREVTPDQRQQAKVAVLACGFGGGVGAFAAMARVYGLSMPESEAQRMVNLWRRANPWAQPMWRRAEDAYRRALRNPGSEFAANRVTYMYDKTHLWYMLPSRRVLCYPYARFDDDGEVSYAKAAWKPSAEAKEWPRAKLWYGVAVENVTQAVAHDVLRESLRAMDVQGISVIAHIHDEVVVECSACAADDVGLRMREIMTAPPGWADGLPLAVDGGVSERFS